MAQVVSVNFRLDEDVKKAWSRCVLNQRETGRSRKQIKIELLQALD